MLVSVRSPKDFWMGVFYAVVGVAALLISRNYSFGAAASMGPGFLPKIVSALLVGVGVISILRSLRTEGEALKATKLLPIFLVLAAILAFALLLETAGFVISALVLLLVSGNASRYSRLDVATLFGAIILVALSALIFIKGLGVAMPVFF